MQVVILSKVPFLKLCREFFTLEFGLVDYDEVLDCLFSGIKGAVTDRRHVRDMVYGDAWVHESYDNDQRSRILAFLWKLRGSVIYQIHQSGHVPPRLLLRYLPKYTTRISLNFEVYE